MADKSELKLAEGSRWEGDTVVEADEEEALCNFSEHDNAFLLWVSRIVAVFAADALAAIRAVDGDPEYLELKRLRATLQSDDDPRVKQLSHECGRLREENEALVEWREALLVKQADVYDEGFSAGFEVAEKALGLSYTHVVEHENPYRKTGE